MSFLRSIFQRCRKKIKNEYISTRKAKMVYRDFAFLGPELVTAALTAECAGEQNKYWDYHDKLFEIEIADGLENNGNLSAELMKSLAKELGLDQAKFVSCLDSQRYRDEIEKDYQSGLVLDVRGTPATFINNELIFGFRPYTIFKQAIDKIIYKK